MAYYQECSWPCMYCRKGQVKYGLTTEGLLALDRARVRCPECGADHALTLSGDLINGCTVHIKLAKPGKKKK